MIKLESVHIEEVRGIRKLDLDFGKQNFAISGPNGSGKSGVIDAIEFCLTGQMGRLAGTGTQGLSVSDHGPHVDKNKFPDASFVTVRAFLTEIRKNATITRMLKSPNKPIVEPGDDDIKAAFAKIADHPEITLSRRDILRFILVEPTKRSEEIQAILKLDEIGQTRNALKTAQNKLQVAHQTTSDQVDSRKQVLQLHLQIQGFRSQDILDAVNKRRRVLNLAPLGELASDTNLAAGLSDISKMPDFNKESALRDLEALSVETKGFVEVATTEVKAMLADLERLEADTALLVALRRRSFVQSGLDLVDGPECPLCDTRWEDEQHLREHLESKLAKSEQARRIQESLSNTGAAIAAEAIRVIGLISPAQKLADREGAREFSQVLNAWKTDLDGLNAKLRKLSELTSLKYRLASGWLAMPNSVPAQLEALSEIVRAKPDQTATVDAQTFITTARLRYSDYRESFKKKEVAERGWSRAKAAYEIYSDVQATELNLLYREVQEDFSAFYRAINEDDESEFRAKFTPAEGKVEFTVNFYDRGLFPPGAYHSEGHQDGMGVCLYLALMKRLFGDQFTLALLDDVVMSVDSGHRHQFCKLLKAKFPTTQFIITTHDRLWAEQMKSAGLVTSKTSKVFYSWSIDTGPLVESSHEIWTEIETALGKGKVEVAAAALRNHLEYVSRNLADNLGATPPFHADGDYELGELLSSVLARMGNLYRKAAQAAQSWGREADKAAVEQRKLSLADANAQVGLENWAVNKAVHYNAWANFGKKDFEPVVAAFKSLLACFACDSCGAWLFVSPRGNSDALRCFCNAVNLNLKSKPKQ
jgi:hypothetical protein